MDNQIELIKKETPYLAAYAWLHNAAVREDNGRDVCRMTIALMHCIRQIESYGATVQTFDAPEIESIRILLHGETVMSIRIREESNDSETVS